LKLQIVTRNSDTTQNSKIKEFSNVNWASGYNCIKSVVIAGRASGWRGAGDEGFERSE
jgi:hypothetical protein